MQTIELDSSNREEFIDITARVQQVVGQSGIAMGIVYLLCLHTTAGLTINENADPDVRRDMLLALGRIVPENLDYRHAEGNSPAHVKSSLMGCQLAVPFADGRLQLGRWQGIYFCEFDGPRRGRTVLLRVMQSATNT